MASYSTPGVIEHFIRFRGDTAWSYLGVATTAPEFEHLPYYNKLMSDLGGRNAPSQLVYDGSQARISTTISRYNQITLNKLLTHARADDGDEDDLNLTRGTLTVKYRDFEALFQYTYAGTAVATENLPAGRWYHSCVLVGAKESTVGTRAKECALVLEANATFDESIRAWYLMTTNISAAGTLTVE